jgi:serine/threonine protein kinase/Tfp pilus assembly protein PilF
MAIRCPKCHFDNPTDTHFCGNCAAPLQATGIRGHEPNSPEFGIVSPDSKTETLHSPQKELSTGSTFANRYQVIEELGKGGMGKVYKVFDTKIKEKIALKLIKPEIASDRETIERFANELKLARKIRHKNVCGMFDIGEAEGAHFITMEYVGGEDLKTMIRMTGMLGMGTVLSVGKQICDGLMEAHSQGVVHRDLKPTNIMIDKGGNAKIMDFGIARSLRERGITGPSVLIGTPEYMSPEQTEAKEVDPRSDIYSLGIILYEMATGRVPFEGETALSIAMKHKGEIPKNPQQLNPNIPDDLSGVILKCLEKDKSKRYQSAAEVHSDLERIERGLPAAERALPKIKSPTSREITVTVKFRRWIVPVLASLGIAAAAFILWRAILHKPPGKLSIAVLPFADELSDSRLELGDSMAEEITGRLRSLQKFPVKSNSAIARFKGTDKSLKSIGEELGVDYLITGKIRAAKEEIEVYVELTEAKSENQVWDERYPDRLSNIMGLQGRIAERIASSLLNALTPEDKEILLKQPTENADAYRLYVEGRQAWNRRDEAGYRQAEERFQQAIAADPKYAKAFAGLADVYTMLGKYREAKDAAQTALDLNPMLAEAHASLGIINLDLEFNVKTAEGEFKRALELDPEYPVAHYWYGRLMNMRGRFDEAIVHLKRSIELDPTALMIYENLGASYFFSGQYDEAVVELKKVIEMDPTQGSHKIVLYATFQVASRYQDLFAALKAYGENESLVGQYWANMAYIQMGEKKRAREFIVKNERALGAVLPSFVSSFYGFFGDLDKGMVWAEKAVEARDSYILYCYSSPLYAPFRSDPRMQALWKRLGLVD